MNTERYDVDAKAPGATTFEQMRPMLVPMATLTDFLSEETGRTVLDNTGFTDVFDFRLEFESTVDSGPSPSGLSSFTAVEEQLGLRLRSTTGPVEVLVIDRVERPSPN